MAKNNLPAELDILTREFYEGVALQAEKFMPDNPVGARRLRGIILDMLGYQVMNNGARIDKTLKPKNTFGQQTDYVDEWKDDLKRNLEALENETDNNQDTTETSTSESAESAEVREAVLPEDV